MMIKPRWVRVVALVATVQLAMTALWPPTLAAQSSDWVVTDPSMLLGVNVSLGDINDFGEMVGSYPTTSGQTHACIWSAADGLRDIAALAGLEGDSGAYALNNRGQVLVRTYTSTGNTFVYLWSAQGGLVDPWTVLRGLPVDINDQGSIVGYRNKPWGGHGPPPTEHPVFVWTPDGGEFDLGVEVHFLNAAMAISETGQVVGTSIGGGAFSWTASGGVINLRFPQAPTALIFLFETSQPGQK
jgi:hypothetical protein